MKIPKWLSTALSFVVVGLIFVAAIFTPHSSTDQSVQHVPQSTLVNTPSFTRDLTIGKTQLHVAFVTTPPEQEQGLSNTASLADDQGMLFVFPTENSIPFWMKDMKYPLDIIWIGSDKYVKDISANLDPSTYPKTFAPKQPTQYVLEVPAGFAEKNKIQIGTKVVF